MSANPGGDDLVRLARRAVDGVPGAQDELLVALQPIIVRTARLIVGAGSSTAEDAAQEATVDVLRGVRSLREPDAVRVWAARIATRRALKAIRRERLVERVRLDGFRDRPSDGSSALDLKEAFDSLPAPLRAVAVLRLYVGLSEEEVARVLECPVGTVKSRLHRAREMLIDRLDASPGHGGGS